MRWGRGYSGLSPRKGAGGQNGLRILGLSPSPFSPFQYGINRNWSLAKGRGMPGRAAGSLAGGSSQKKSPASDLYSPTGDIGRGSETFPYPDPPFLGLFSERWAAETELPP